MTVHLTPGMLLDLEEGMRVATDSGDGADNGYRHLTGRIRLIEYIEADPDGHHPASFLVARVPGASDDPQFFPTVEDLKAHANL